MNKKFKPDIKVSKLKDKDIVQILHMEDYFSEETPWAGKPTTYKSFVKDNLIIDEDEELTLDEWYQGSGDGGENFALLTIHDGQIKVVVP